MIPLVIENATHVFKPPRDYDGRKGNMQPLHVIQTEGCLVSRWEPSPNELAILNEGGSVELWVMGNKQPPVFIKVNKLVNDE